MANGLNDYLTAHGTQEAYNEILKELVTERKTKIQWQKEMYEARNIITERLSHAYTPRGYTEMKAFELWTYLEARYKPKGTKPLLTSVAAALDISLNACKNNPVDFVEKWALAWKDVEGAAKAERLPDLPLDWQKLLFISATRLPSDNDPWRQWRNGILRQDKLPGFDKMVQDFIAERPDAKNNKAITVADW